MIYNQELLNTIKDIIVAGEHTLAVAESVTSGHLQAAFSGAMDASKYFQGGITAYNLGQKARHLNVEPILAEKVNSVEPRVADTMAIEVSKMFLSNYGVGITGYAALVPECVQDGLYAYFSLSFDGKVVLSQKLTSPAKFPPDVQVDYTNQVIKLVHDYLKSK
jgi:nicotinamide-nucleotide amidase